MFDLEVLTNPRAASAALDPMRQRLLVELGDPASASMLAARLEIPRQKITYHLNQMLEVGLVEVVELRAKGIMTERIMQATATAYVISPQSIDVLSPSAHAMRNEASASWLLALAARTIREVGTLLLGARQAGKDFGTFAIDAEIDFATARDRAEFARELGASVATLAAKYQNTTQATGRAHRLVVSLHPTLKEHTP
ncbi:helix-turn-helix domain-containing protein [Paeniglutamicibacter sp. Y32M11]|uniref:winged helix-turn-helix domain-containing protein n=1 Tax=Paeniglutamicibacter sp. Y32M11 TaxID=2853258 RepID=UPI001C52EB1E|nr:helix-turn-helix domain-containing protein [Paeniglutamicibacter sp. Y32M11]QXQ09369.1 helix-turn-helix domain-containing protein [Paeniglutamicibacter sp. Y32M11]